MLRILADRARRGIDPPDVMADEVLGTFVFGKARVRSIALESLHPDWVQRCSPKKKSQLMESLLALTEIDEDRVCYYKVWHAIRENLSIQEQAALLDDERPRVRLAAVLALAEDRLITDEQAEELVKDDDAAVREVAALWMAKRNGSELLTFNEPSQEFVNELELDVNASVKPAEIYYTCLLYTSPSPRDATLSRMPSSA